MSSTHRQQVLSLYRRILRTARAWAGPQEEKEYIVHEARQQFRADRDSSDVEAKLVEGESRLQLAVHYQIPYPRLHHAPQLYTTKHVPPPKLEDTPEAKLSSRDSEVSNKLAAAMRRRQEKLAQGK